jgi:cytochrome c-type biogenesis protein CcmH/NrfF
MGKERGEKLFIFTLFLIFTLSDTTKSKNQDAETMLSNILAQLHCINIYCSAIC